MAKPKQNKSVKRILLVDDHPMIRQGLARLINEDPKLVVAGEAGTCVDALRFVAKEKPDLAIIDLSLPDRDGLSLLKELLALHPDLSVLILSMHDETIYAERIIRAGGRGYIMKNKSSEQVMKAIHHVLAGEIYISPAMSQSILSRLSPAKREDNLAAVDNLSDRELQVYRLIGQGFKCSEIANRLHLSPKTIETHSNNIRNKLNLNDANELRRRAIQWSSGEKTFS